MLHPCPTGIERRHSHGLPFALRVLLWEIPDPSSDRVCIVVQGRHEEAAEAGAAAELFAHLATLVCKEAANEPQITLEKLSGKLQRGQARFEAAQRTKRHEAL